MAADCGLNYDHDPHLDEDSGAIYKCDGDSSKRENYDAPVIRVTGHA
jgi:hypothetical protein